MAKIISHALPESPVPRAGEGERETSTGKRSGAAYAAPLLADAMGPDSLC